MTRQRGYKVSPDARILVPLALTSPAGGRGETCARPSTRDPRRRFENDHVDESGHYRANKLNRAR